MSNIFAYTFLFQIQETNVNVFLSLLLYAAMVINGNLACIHLKICA